MEEIVKLAFYDEMEKIAINIGTLRSVARSQKMAPTIFGKGDFYKIDAYKGNSDLTKVLVDIGKKEYKGKNLNIYLKNINNKKPMAVSGDIEAFTSSLTNAIKSAPKRTHKILDDIPKDKKSKKIMSDIFTMHEKFEARSRGIAPFSSHADPDVIFKEHNILTTLPKKHAGPAIEFIKKMRGVGGKKNKWVSLNEPEDIEANIFPKQIEFGSGSRLSRHAIKRLSENFKLKRDQELGNLILGKG